MFSVGLPLNRTVRPATPQLGPIAATLGATATPEVAHSIVLATLGAAADAAIAIPARAHAWVAAHRRRAWRPAPLVRLNLAVPGSPLPGSWGSSHSPAPRMAA
jgi:hypothetical protein